MGENSTARLNGNSWKTNLVPKVRNFLWRACFNILPNRDNLQKRRVKVDPRYEFCCQSLEIVGYVLWEFPFARNIWALVLGKIQKCLNVAPAFFLLFFMLHDKLEQRDL